MCDSAEIWLPSSAESTKMFDFIKHVNQVCLLDLKNYQQLWRWSVENVSLFWDTFLKYSKIKYEGSYEKVVDESLRMDTLPPVWFKGIKLNYAENLLHKNSYNTGLIAENEFRTLYTFTHQELYKHTARLFHAFKRYGLKPGDIVASSLPNDHRALISMLACTSLGCIWTAMPTELQAVGVLQKMQGIRPRIYLSSDKAKYGGVVFDQLPKLQSISQGMDFLEQIVIFTVDSTENFCHSKFISIDDFFLKYGKTKDIDCDIQFEMVPFSHPLFILYTSGTTGPSKKLVHSVGGTLIKLAMEHMLHGDLSNQDVVFYNTSPGWIMWNWVVTSLFTGCTLVLYDGSPIKPDPLILWELAARNNITAFGSGAAYYYIIEQMKVSPKQCFVFPHLRYILSIGSHLPTSSYAFLQNHVKNDVPICSLTGATDIISCFSSHNLTLPVYPGESQYCTLGMFIRCFDENGTHLEDQKGELVIIKPFPSMPIFVWNDLNNEIYKTTYFSQYPGIWKHGDFCVFNSITGGFTILGRSDATLNVNGVRIGTTEIYSVVEQIEEVKDSLCVCQDLGDGRERMILFIEHHVLLHNDFKKLAQKIIDVITKTLSKRYLPALILPCPKIPYTITGKKVEILVRRIISKQPFKINHESLSNPNELEYFKNLQI